MHVLAALAVSITLNVQGRTNATPTVAADGPLVVVAWSATLPAGTTDIFAAVSRDGAQTFAAPIRVNDVEGDARANGEQPPRIALVRGAGVSPDITIVWTAKGTNGTRLVSARSADGGRSFTRAATVRGSDAPGNRGWHNLLAAPDGKVFTIWLDHREMADHAMGAAPAHGHGAGQKMDGAVMAEKSKLYIGSLDGAIVPRPITGGVCYCCKTAIAASGDGAIVAAWRHVYPGNFRDIAFTTSSDGGRTFGPPLRVSDDQWMLEGCPDDGPAIAVDSSKRVHVAWPTLVKDDKTGEPTIAIFYATSSDAKTFTPRVRLPAQGVAHHPQIAIAHDGTPVIAWDEGESGRRRIVVTGVPSLERTVVTGDDNGVYPALARAGSAVVAVWTAPQPSGSTIRVARIR